MRFLRLPIIWASSIFLGGELSMTVQAHADEEVTQFLNLDVAVMVAERAPERTMDDAHGTSFTIQ